MMLRNISQNILAGMDYIAIQFDILGEDYLYVLKNRFGETGVAKNGFIEKGSALVLSYNMLDRIEKSSLKKAIKSELIS